IGMPASSDMVGGMDALIHRFPSSSVGKNSLPNLDPTTALAARKIIPAAIVILRLLSDQRSAGVKTRRKLRTTLVSTSSTCSGSKSEARHGVTVKVAMSAPTSA